MNCNNYQKVVHCCLWYGRKLSLSKRLKEGFHKNFYQDSGGKVEKNESILKAIQREVYEETGQWFFSEDFELIDCFIYHERKIKTFLFKINLTREEFKLVKNTEPDKQTNWKLFTLKEALKLKLMPSVKYYLENLNER